MSSYKDLSEYIKSVTPDLQNEDDKLVAEYAVESFPDQFRREEFDWNEPVSVPASGQLTTPIIYRSKDVSVPSETVEEPYSPIGEQQIKPLSGEELKTASLPTSTDADVAAIQEKQWRPQATVAGLAQRAIGAGKRLIGTEMQKVAPISISPEQTATKAQKIKAEATVAGEAAELVDPTWYRSENIQERINEIKGQNPNIGNSLEMGDIAGATDILVFNAFLGGNEAAKNSAIQTARDVRDVAGERAGKAKKGVVGTIENVVNATAEMLPMMGKSAALSAIPIIGTALTTSMWVQQGAGDVITGLKDEGVEDDVALSYGLLGALPYAAIEQLQIGHILGTGAKKAVSGSIKKKLAAIAKEKGKDLFKEMAEEGTQAAILESVTIDALKESGIEVDDERSRIINSFIEDFKASAGPMGILSLLGFGAGAAGVRRGKPTKTKAIGETGTPLEETTPKLEIQKGEQLSFSDYNKLPAEEKDNNFYRLSEADQDRAVAQYEETDDVEEVGNKDERLDEQVPTDQGQEENIPFRGDAEVSKGGELPAPFAKPTYTEVSQKIGRRREDIKRAVTKEQKESVESGVSAYQDELLKEYGETRPTKKEVAERFKINREKAGTRINAVYGKLDEGKQERQKSRVETVVPRKTEEVDKRGLEIQNILPGVKYRGIQEGAKAGKRVVPPTMLFDDEVTGSTLSIRPNQTAADLQKKMRDTRFADNEAKIDEVVGKAEGLKYSGKKVVKLENGVKQLNKIYTTKAGKTITVKPTDTVEDIQNRITPLTEGVKDVPEMRKQTETEVKDELEEKAKEERVVVPPKEMITGKTNPPKPAKGEKEPESATSIQQKVMTEEEYLSTNGASRQDIGEAALHKNIPEGKIRKRLVETQRKKDAEVISKRDELRKEYKEKVEKGEIRPPTRIESLWRTAQGQKENEAVKSAKKLLEKRGVDWKKPLEDQNIEGSQSTLKFSRRDEPNKIDNDDAENKIKKYFGVTGDLKFGGYIVKDGDILDLSGRNQGNISATQRSLDHREIVFADESLQEDGTKGMLEYMNKGNIRIDYNSGFIHMLNIPTTEQIKVIKRFIREKKGEIRIELGKSPETYGKALNRDYDSGTNEMTIIRDIQNYYSGKMINNERTLIQQYHQTDDIQFSKKESNETEGREQKAPPVQKGRTEEEKKIIDAIYREYGKKPNYSVLSFAAGGKVQEELADVFKELTGDPVQFVSVDQQAIQKDGIDQFDGFRHNGTIYLNISEPWQRPLLWTAFHEWYHGLTDNERKFIEQAASVTDAGWKRISDKGHEEFFADIAGEIMSHPETLEYMAKENPVRLRKIIQKLIDTINTLVEKFKRLVTGDKQVTYTKYITNAEAIRDQLITVLEKRMGKDMAVEMATVFSYRQKTDPFFSPLLKAVQNLKQQKGTGEQMFNMLTKTPGVKEAEWKWMGLDDFLKGKKSVTRGEIEEFVRNNEVRVEEVEKGKKYRPVSGKKTYVWSDVSGNYLIEAGNYDEAESIAAETNGISVEELREADETNLDEVKDIEKFVEVYGDVKPVNSDFFASDPTKYTEYQLPGGENYREVLLTLPMKNKGRYSEVTRELTDAEMSELNRLANIRDRTQEQQNRYLYLGKINDGTLEEQEFKDTFKSSHWDEPNVIAHIRMNDREANGEKVLFIEEIQSDWSREARDKGIALPNKAELEARRIEIENKGKSATAEERQEWVEIQNKLQPQKEDKRVPAQPFLKNWEELTLKRILRMAAEEGYDRVAWINGEQTAARYDLSKQISKVIYQPENKLLIAYETGGNEVLRKKGVSPEEIADHIGKEPAKRLLEAPITGTGDNIGGMKEQMIKGHDLKIGGEWATALYDKMIPKFYEKYLKKWGVKVESVNLGSGTSRTSNNNEYTIENYGDDNWVVLKNGEEYSSAKSEEEAQVIVDRHTVEEVETTSEIGTQQSIRITPEMANSVLYEGQPMFSKREKIVDDATTPNTTFYQIGDVTEQKKELRKKLGKIKENLLDDRIVLENEIKKLDEKNRDQIAASIIGYAQRIGLRGEPYNRVDILVKNVKTAKGFQRAIEVMDNVMEKRNHRRYYKAAKEAIKDAYSYLKRIEGKTRPTTDLETNRALKTYLDSISGEISETTRKAKLMADYYANYQDEEHKENRNIYIEELGEEIVSWIDEAKEDVPEQAQKYIAVLASNGLEGMSNNALIRVIRDIKSLRKTGRTIKSIRDKKEQERVGEAANKITAAIKANSKSLQLETPVQKATGSVQKAEKKRRFSLKNAGNIIYTALETETILDRVTGTKGESILKSEVFDPMYNAVSTEKKNLKIAIDKFRERYSDTDIAFVNHEPLITIEVDGYDENNNLKKTDLTLTYNEGMYFYAMSMNDSQREALIWTLARPVTEKDFDGNKDLYNQLKDSANEEKHRIGDALIDEVVNALPDNYKELVRKQWTYYKDEQHSRINSEYAKVHGIDMPSEEYYFPISRDFKSASNMINIDLMERMGFRKAKVSGKFTISRVASKAPIKKFDYFGTVIGNMLQAEHYIAFNEPVNRVRRVLNNPDVHDEIYNFNPEAWNKIDDWLKALAYGRSDYGSKDDELSKKIRSLRKNAAVFQLGFKATTIMIQSSSYFRGMSQVNKKYIAKSWGELSKAIREGKTKEFFKGIDELSPIMASREQDSEQILQEWFESGIADKILKTEKAGQKLKGKAMKLMSSYDKFLAAMIWKTKFDEVMNTGSFATEKEAIDKAVYEADKVVRRTQSGGGMLTSTGMQRGAEWQRMYTQYSSDSIKGFNMLVSFFDHFNEMDTKEKASIIAYGFILPAIVANFIRSGFKPPWEEPEEVAVEAVKSFSDGLPIFSTIANTMAVVGTDKIKQLRGKPPYTYYDYVTDPNAPVIGVVEDIATSIKEGIIDQKFYKAIGAAGTILGAPGGAQVTRVIKEGKTVLEGGNLGRLVFGSRADREFDIVSKYYGKNPASSKNIDLATKYIKWAEKEYRAWDDKKKAKYRKYVIRKKKESPPETLERVEREQGNIYSRKKEGGDIKGAKLAKEEMKAFKEVLTPDIKEYFKKEMSKPYPKGFNKIYALENSSKTIEKAKAKIKKRKLTIGERRLYIKFEKEKNGERN